MSAATTTMDGNQMHSRVSKMDRLNARVSKLLTVAVQEVLELVRETVLEYQEKTARTQRENERLRQRLRDAMGRLESERAAAERRAQLASVLERAILQEQEHQQQEHQQQGELARISPVKHRDSPDEKEEPPVSEQTAGGVEEEQKLTAETLTECAVRVQLMFTDHDRTVSEDTAPADEGAKPHSDDRIIKCDADATPVSPATFITTTTTMATSIPSPSNLTLSDVHPVAAERVKTEPASPSSPVSQQEAPLSSFGLPDDQSPARPLPTSSQTLNSTAGPYGLLFVPASQQPPQQPQQQQQQHHHHQAAQGLGRRLGSSLALVRAPRLSSDPRRGLHRQGSARRYDPQTCGVCGKTFSRLGNLRIHERCHTGEKPYGCGQCGRCFSQAGDLKKHQRVHTGEKPYYCGQCGKSFSRGENLRRHQKIHVGERIQLQQAWADLRHTQR